MSETKAKSSTPKESKKDEPKQEAPKQEAPKQPDQEWRVVVRRSPLPKLLKTATYHAPDKAGAWQAHKEAVEKELTKTDAGKRVFDAWNALLSQTGGELPADGDILLESEHLGKQRQSREAAQEAMKKLDKDDLKQTMVDVLAAQDRATISELMGRLKELEQKVK